MPNGPQTRFFLSSTGASIEETDLLWHEPLPLGRTPESSGMSPKDPAPVTYGDYFKASRLFLEAKDHRVVRDAATRRAGKTIPKREIRSIDIFLEKHGPFYHPARVLVRAGGVRIPLVLNVAVSDAGLDRIEKEYRFIKKLNDTTPWRFLPQVDSLGRCSAGGSGRKVKMFLGEWIEEYHEFHVCGFSAGGEAEIRVWDGRNARLSRDLVPAVYREAAKILTAYYDLYTFDQIFPWHHAAGDFIVRVQEERLDLKLVSVRRYAPLVSPVQEDLKSMVEALLVFFLNLSIRMRLDRIEGIGDTVWADDRAVRSTLSGFFAGMALKTAHDPIAEPLTVLFKDYLLSCSESDLSEVCEAVVCGYPPDSIENGFIRKRLDRHIAVLHREIRSGLQPDLHPGAPPHRASSPQPIPDC